MSDDPSTVEPSSFQGRTAFGEALRLQVESAAAMPPAPIPLELVWIDVDFSDWALDSPAITAGLSRFLRLRGRRLRMVAARWDDMAQRHPRFTAWRRDYTHAVEPFVAIEPVALRPMALGPADLIEVADTVFWRGTIRRAPAERAAALPTIALWLQACEPGWPATTLGL